jgi:hypothetical protein
MQRYDLQIVNGREVIDVDPEGRFVKFTDIPLQPVPAHAEWIANPDSDGEWWFKSLRGGKPRVCEVNMYLWEATFVEETEPHGIGDDGDGLVGEWQKATPSMSVNKVPEPLPWLDQPDGDGYWWFIGSGGKPLLCLVSIYFWSAHFAGDDEQSDIEDMKGRWQRIPQPILPGEGGSDG